MKFTDFHVMLYFVATFVIINVGGVYLGTHPEEITNPMLLMFALGVGWEIYFFTTWDAIMKWWRQPYRTRIEEEIP